MPRSFDTIARIYAPLERLTFGSVLQSVRLDSLQQLDTAPRHALILGDGDGRYSEALLKRFPECHIDSIDISPAMHAQAAERLKEQFGKLPSHYRSITADARNTEFPLSQYDFIGLHFFLDCLNDTDCGKILEQCTQALRPEGTLSFADFTIPTTGMRKYVCSALVKLLYLSFRWTTGLKTKQLPVIDWPNSLTLIHHKKNLGGLLENKLFRLYLNPATGKACRQGKAQVT